MQICRVVRSDAPHAPEHALEVELPFLQTILPEFTLMPLVVGEATPQEVAMVLGRLWGADETLIVVSSDLSHYLRYQAAQRMDSITAAAIEGGDWSKLRSSQACGCLPVAGLLIEVKSNCLRARRLALCNSGDTAGPRNQFVGYGAWIFFQPRTYNKRSRCPRLGPIIGLVKRMTLPSSRQSAFVVS